MADDQDKPEGRVIAGGGENIFKNATGGRSDYGQLIISALTGHSPETLQKQMAERLEGEELKKFKKELATSGNVDATLLDAEDQFFRDYLRIHSGPSLIAPPIAPERLERLVAENNALEPCIAAMVTNISCTGMEIKPTEGTEAELTDEQKKVRDGLWDFFMEPAPRKSFTRIRKELRRDLHVTGNSYMVIERTMDGKVAFIRRAPAKSMRIIKLDEPVKVEVEVKRNGEMITLTTMRAERRYVQKIGTKLVYYKEYGSKRDLNRTTGEWAREGQTLAPNERAHEILHDKDIEDVKSPYGMPRWITQLPSVLGSRMAEEHNLAFFQSGGVPPVIVFISGGLVSEQVATALNSYLGGTSKDKQRGLAVEVPSSGDIQSERPANVAVERFGSQEQDSTFENYDEKNEARIRRSFRLPGIFLGMSDNYNFATAHASYVVAEAQVFAPEREEEDERFNMTIMREIDPSGEWKILSNPLSVQDVNLQLQALSMLGTTKGVGVADLVDAISQVSGLEIEVHEDHQGDVIGGGTMPGAVPGQPGVTPPDGPSGDAPPPGAGNNGPEPANDAEPPTPGVTSTTKRQAHVLASKIARTIRDFEDTNDSRYMLDLLDCEATYDRMAPGVQAIVNNALAPVMFNSPFLSEAAMADLAIGYAKASFNAARTLQQKEAAQ